MSSRVLFCYEQDLPSETFKKGGGRELEKKKKKATVKLVSKLKEKIIFN